MSTWAWWGPSWSTRTFTGCSFNLPQATGFLNDDLGKNAWAADEGPVRVWVR
ncbi:MAG TPA: hypothetical protein QGF58_16150 [Myxococcota bacterium]|nr:hypothetical protein [Myxococcota bacterium]